AASSPAPPAARWWCWSNELEFEITECARVSNLHRRQINRLRHAPNALLTGGSAVGKRPPQPAVRPRPASARPPPGAGLCLFPKDRPAGGTRIAGVRDRVR